MAEKKTNVLITLAFVHIPTSESSVESNWRPVPLGYSRDWF